MSFLRTLCRISKHSSTSENFEKYATEELQKDPRNLMLLEAAAHHFWRAGNYAFGFEYSVRALELHGDSREMLLLAAASAFRLGNKESAFRYACMAVKSAEPILTKEQLSNSSVFRFLVRVPALRNRLSVLRRDWEARSNHTQELFRWAEEFTRFNSDSPSMKE